MFLNKFHIRCKLSNYDAILYYPQLSSSIILTIEINLFNDSVYSSLLILISDEPFKNYNYV